MKARMACVGEALERCQAQPLSQDGCVSASFADWPLEEPAAAPDRWVLFHPSQYELPDVPFRPFERGTTCRWVCFRSVPERSPIWVPEQLAFLYPRRGTITALPQPPRPA
jgi:ribosomal protein S12 methylthiotransferase accessory factor